MRLRASICLTLLFFISFTYVDTVHACTGAPPFTWGLRGLLENYPSVVMGQINALSDSGINAVLRIDYILRGDITSEYRIFTYNYPSDIQLHNEGRSPGSNCQTPGLKLNSGRRFIAGLHRFDEGVNFGTLIMENDEGLFVVHDPDQLQQQLTLDYEYLLEYASGWLGEGVRSPQDNTMPRAGIVRLLTESGNVYRLPIDEAIPVANSLMNDLNSCSSYINYPCTGTIFAPNGVDTISLYPVGSDVRNRIGLDARYHTGVEGEAGVFTAFSDVLAVWAGQEIHIYAMASQPKLAIPLMNQPLLLHVRQFNPDDPLIAGAGAWNPDGRTFALASESGVWMWDILSADSQPVLLLPVLDEPILVRHFSPAGNYLALTSNGRNYHADIRTLDEHPDGLFSPDERNLAAFDTSASALTPMVMYTTIPEFTPLYGGSFSAGITQFEWVNRNTYIYAACGEGTYEPEMLPGFDQDWCKVFKVAIGLSGMEYSDGILFDYDPVTDSIATLINDNTITFNGEVISFGDEYDERIIGIEIIPIIDLNHRNF